LRATHTTLSQKGNIAHARRQMPHESRCSPREIQNYLGRVSGPLLDRIDLPGFTVFAIRSINVPSAFFD
jgi:predicted ATPase with chaperone activity